MFHLAQDSLPLPHDDLFPSKLPATNGPLYLQQRSLEIIQLIEVPPPPRPQHPSTFSGSSFASSSYTSSTDESEDKSACSSYCSSDPEEESRLSVPDDTYKTRLHRVLVWREKLAKSMGASIVASPHSPLSSPPPKRKAETDAHEADGDTASHSSKRSRSGPYRSQAPRSPSSLSAHSCPACDAFFPTRQSLQQHGRGSSSNDACRAAVEYDCEA